MEDNGQLTGLSVALVLAGVAVLAVLAAFFTEGRGSKWLLFWLAVIWLLACVAFFALNPTTWPNETA